MFDFFHLPQELRDHVYSYLLDKRADLSSMEGLHVRIRNGPWTKFMLINRQFKDEYLKQSERRTVLVYLDTGHNLPVIPEPILLPPTLRLIRRVELRLWLVCNEVAHKNKCKAKKDFRFPLSWVGPLIAQMPSSKLSVLLGLYQRNGTDCNEECTALHMRLVDLPGFQRLVIRSGPVPPSAENEGQTQVVYKYNSRTQQLEAVVPVEGDLPVTQETFGFAAEDDYLTEDESSDDESTEGEDEDGNEGDEMDEDDGEVADSEPQSEGEDGENGEDDEAEENFALDSAIRSRGGADVDASRAEYRGSCALGEFRTISQSCPRVGQEDEPSSQVWPFERRGRARRRPG